jgi:hypothetical protein
MSTPNGHGRVKHTFDMENDFQAEVPVEWTIAPMQTPSGQRLAACFRVPNTTLTLVLQKEAAESLRDTLSHAIAGMSGLILPPGN